MRDWSVLACRGKACVLGCLDENSVVALFESRLAPEAAARAEDHLASCEHCRRVLAEYAKMAGQAEMASAANTTGALAAEASVVPTSISEVMEQGDLGHRLAYALAVKRVGTVLCAKWRIDRLIGIGGMAQVYAATHRNGRAVAVKVMRSEFTAEPQIVHRFLREGYVANRVGHRGAVAVLDDDTTPDGMPFLVMELLHGRSLRQRLSEDGPLGMAAALRVADDVLDVLAAAHEKGIIHRDIKPENLFETDEGLIKVLDFGIARLRDSVGSASNASGLLVGTVGYMAPEQARGAQDAVDPRTDIWAVGATLFELLSGRTPHNAPNLNELLLLAMTASVPPVRDLVAGLPPAVCDVLDRALRFDKTARFANCRDMQQALRSARGEASLPVPPPAAAGKTLVESANASKAARTARTARTSVGIGATIVLLASLAAIVVVQKARARLDPPSTSSGGPAASVLPTDEKPRPVEETKTAVPRQAADSAPLVVTASAQSPATPSASEAEQKGSGVAPQARPKPGRRHSTATADATAAARAPEADLDSKNATPGRAPSCRVVSYFDDDGNKHFREECR